MNGRRAKILRRMARRLAAVNGRSVPARRLHAVDLPQRKKWVDVPDDGKTFIEKLRNKFLRSLGLPTPTKRVEVWITPQVLREQKGTVRWVYRQLKRRYYAARAS